MYKRAKHWENNKPQKPNDQQDEYYSDKCIHVFIIHYWPEDDIHFKLLQKSKRLALFVGATGPANAMDIVVICCR